MTKNPTVEVNNCVQYLGSPTIVDERLSKGTYPPHVVQLSASSVPSHKPRKMSQIVRSPIDLNAVCNNVIAFRSSVITVKLSLSCGRWQLRNQVGSISGWRCEGKVRSLSSVEDATYIPDDARRIVKPICEDDRTQVDRPDSESIIHLIASAWLRISRISWL
jgi:hypothetical protein